MKRCMQDTIYMLGPFLSFLLVLFTIMTPILYNIEKIQNSLIAYSECSSKMIDYAFLGQVFNFTECYLNELNNKENVTCEIDNDKMICFYKGEEFIYPLFLNNTSS